MKLTEIFENVIDFAQARAKRDAEAKINRQEQQLSQDYERLVNDDEAEGQTVQELAEFEEWMNVAKKKGRVPGFDTMDDAIAFLLADAEMPTHITHAKAIEWFKALSEDEREKARMIAHHADRMIQIYTMLKTKLHGILDTWSLRFGGKIPRGWDATDGAAFLDSEFAYDIATLKRLKKAIEIIGQ